MALSNLPTIGADNDTWGQELNDALTELDTIKADKTAVYTKGETDGRYVRTVNSTAPDGSGNVVVAGGGGGSTVPADGSVTDAKIAAGGLSPTVIAGTAITNSDTRLTNTRTPTVHKTSHATGGSDALAPADIGAVAVTSIGSSVAPLGVGAKVPNANLPGVALFADGLQHKIWAQNTAPTVGQGAAENDVWFPTP